MARPPAQKPSNWYFQLIGEGQRAYDFRMSHPDSFTGLGFLREDAAYTSVAREYNSLVGADSGASKIRTAAKKAISTRLSRAALRLHLKINFVVVGKSGTLGRTRRKFRIH